MQSVFVRIAIASVVGLCSINTAAQGPPCRTFTHGTFEEGTHTKQEVLSGKKEGVRILRRGKGHVETDRATRRKVRYTVRWTDDCTFELTNAQVKNPGRGVPTAPPDTIVVQITNTWKYGYAYSKTEKGTDRVHTGTMTMIIPKGGGISFGL